MASTNPTSGFDQIQVGDWVYTNNAYGINLGAGQGTIQWNVPDGGSLGGNCYDLPAEGTAADTGECTICHELHEGIGDTTRVRAFPMMILGSQGGRDTTWGASKNGCPSPITELVAAPSRCGNSAMYDLRQANAAVGYPALASAIPATEICFNADINCTGAQDNLSNIFIDTYWHRTDKPNLYPDGYNQALHGDLNKINENKTEAWNLNFWTCLPPTSINGNSDGGWTGGGSPVLTGVGIDGKSWDIYFKKEGGGSCTRDIDGNIQNGNDCDNCFFYVSFVANPQLCGQDICINYNAFADWVKSSTFESLITTPGSVGNGIWLDVGQPPLPSTEQFVIDGLAIGSEIWYSPNSQESCVCLSGVSATVDGKVISKGSEIIDPDPVCTLATASSRTTTSTPPDPTDGTCIVIGSEPACLTIGGGTSNAHYDLQPYNPKTCNDTGCDCWFEAHQPALIHCNMCMTDGAVITSTGTTTEGTRAEYTCDCETGLDWRTNGPISYTVTTPAPKAASAFIVWGHDLCTTGAEIQIYENGNLLELDSHSGTSAIIAQNCDHCCGGDDQCKAVAVYFNSECNQATERTAVINTTGDHIISQMGFYQVTTEGICIYEGDQNPFTATRFESNSKQNGCGWLPSTKKARMVPFELNLLDLSENYLDNVLVPIIHEAQDNIVYYAQSINRKNCDIAQARIGDVSGSIYDGCLQTMTIPMELNMHSGIK